LGDETRTERLDDMEHGMEPVREWVEALGTFYQRYGYTLVFVGALAENTALLGLVLPGGTMALLGAFYARQGTLNLGWVILCAWMGTVLGYHADYLIGRFLLVRVAAQWSASPLGRRLRLAGKLRQARALLARHGGKAILFSHLIGHVRSFVALTAGMTHLRYRRFLTAELVAALLWNVAFGVAGYVVGAEWSRLQLLLERFGWVALGCLVLSYLAWRFLRRRPVPRQRCGPAGG
jgi:membrane protein DedA with SNARE-associated domain